jgi:ATP-dependent RNA helicase RhlE
LEGFRSGSFKILVATDIAARGIDVLDISHVINFDMPDSTDSYIHRIGRTGRIGKSGNAFTLVTGEDTAMVRSLERLLSQTFEQRTLKGFNYTSPAPAKKYTRPLRQLERHFA